MVFCCQILNKRLIHINSCVCVCVCLCDPTEYCEYWIGVVLRHILTNVFVCHSFNSWFFSDVISKICPTSASTYYPVKLVESGAVDCILKPPVAGSKPGTGFPEM